MLRSVNPESFKATEHAKRMREQAWGCRTEESTVEDVVQGLAGLLRFCPTLGPGAQETIRRNLDPPAVRLVFREDRAIPAAAHASIRHPPIAANVLMFDSSGHASDPELRRNGSPPADNQVRPITLKDNVWIGRNAIIFPGVTIGEGSIVSAGAVVMADVPAYTVVAGNPARKILPGIRCPSGTGE